MGASRDISLAEVAKEAGAECRASCMSAWITGSMPWRNR